MCLHLRICGPYYIEHGAFSIKACNKTDALRTMLDIKTK